MTRLLHEVRIDCSAEHNDILPVLLGLTKFLENIDSQVCRSASGDLLSQADEQVVLALLGLLGVRRKFNRWLDQCAAKTVSGDEETADSRKPQASLWR